MILFRADGNARIGTGHIMRCLSIASAVRELGHSCMFITADENMTALLESRGFPFICLHSTWNDLEQEIGQMEELLRQIEAHVLLVDSYYATADYLRRLQQLTHVAYIDDLDAFTCPCPTIINYNIYGTQWNYAERYPHHTLLLGPRYVPLRKEFFYIGRRNVEKTVSHVLISTGGSDPANIAGRVACTALQAGKFTGITFHIVAGCFNQHLAMLQDLEQASPYVKIHRNVQSISELMLTCDLAISAAGSTLYELCACGTPTVTYVLADNQLSGAKAFGAEGIMLHAGDARVDACFIDSVLDKLSILVQDERLRAAMSERMQNLVDGNGANRLAQALLR